MRDRQPHLGDRLRAPAPHLLEDGDIVGAPRDADRDDELVGPPPHLLVAGVEAVERDVFLSGPGGEHDDRVVRHQHGDAVGGGRSVDDVAGPGAARLDLHRPDLARGGDEQGKPLLHPPGVDHVPVGRERAQHQLAVPEGDGFELGDPRQVHVVTIVLGDPGRPVNEEIGRARDRYGLRLPGDPVQRFAQRSRLVDGHARASASSAAWTPATMPS